MQIAIILIVATVRNPLYPLLSFANVNKDILAMVRTAVMSMNATKTLWHKPKLYQSHGSYQCVFKPGYEGGNCSNINLCNLSNIFGNNFMCTDTDGNYECTYIDGYADSASRCQDIDECISSQCDDNASCTNMYGDYSCNYDDT